METLVMKFHDYLDKALGTKTKVKALRVLFRFPGKDFTTRELSKLVGVSHTGVLKALKELEEMNVVDIGTHGRAYVVRLNNESFLIQPLRYLFDLEGNTVDHLAKDIKKAFRARDVDSVAIFGSIAKGNEESRSDIDLLIITKDKKKAEDGVSKLQGEIVGKYGNPISPHIMLPEEFKKESGFRKDVLSYHMVVVGKRLEEI
jgi:predicted nucleotidyltransferase